MIEELGTYDPSIADTDARTVINGERIKYWLSVGAQPSDRVRVLIKKYGPEGTHVKQQQAALEKLKGPKAIPEAGPAGIRAAAEERAERIARRSGSRGSGRSQRAGSRRARRTGRRVIRAGVWLMFSARLAGGNFDAGRSRCRKMCLTP